MNNSIQPLNKKISAAHEELLLNRYRLGRNIGQGSQGQVKLAHDTQTGNRVAIKIYKHRKMNDLDFVYLKREVNILSQLKGHKAFVNLIDFAEHINYVNGHGQTEIISAIVMEYANNGCLFDLVSFFREKYNENMIRLIALQLIDAIEHMQQFQISHRDIKLENIVLDSKYNLKVIDFGLAVQESRDGKPKSNVGTNPFAPPERFLGKEYCGLKFDVFSLGVLLFFLKFNYYPFINNNPEKSEETGSFFLFSQNRQQFWEQIVNTENVEDLHFVDFINSMLHQDPQHRPSLEQIRMHPFLQRNTNCSQSIQSYLSMRKEVMNEMLKNQRKQKLNQKQQEQQEQLQVPQQKEQGMVETPVNTSPNGNDAASDELALQNQQISSVGTNQQILAVQSQLQVQQPQEISYQFKQEFQQEILINNQYQQKQNLYITDKQLCTTIENTDHQHQCACGQDSIGYEQTDKNKKPLIEKCQKPKCKKINSRDTNKIEENYNFNQSISLIRELIPKQQMYLVLTKQKNFQSSISNSNQLFFLSTNAKQQAAYTFQHRTNFHQLNAKENQHYDQQTITINQNQKNTLLGVGVFLSNIPFQYSIIPEQLHQQQQLSRKQIDENHSSYIQFIINSSHLQSTNFRTNQLFQFHSFFLRFILILQYLFLAICTGYNQLTYQQPNYSLNIHQLFQSHYMINSHHIFSSEIAV